MDLSADLFVSSAVVAKTIKLGDGSEHEFFFRKVSSYEWSRFIAHAGSKVADERADAANIMVAASLCDGAGKAVITIEKARSLRGEVLDQMFSHAMEVNKKEEKKGNA